MHVIFNASDANQSINLPLYFVIFYYTKDDHIEILAELVSDGWHTLMCAEYYMI